MTKKIAIIIPTYNEKVNLEKLLPCLSRLYPNFPIYIVDDNSCDQTAKYITEFAKRHPQIFLIERSQKSGRGSAVLAGLKKANTCPAIDYFLEMDADFSHDPIDIRRFIEKASSQMIIIGSRYVKGGTTPNWPLSRRILSKLANYYIRIILKINLYDFTNGFRLYPKNAVNVLLESKIQESGYAFLSEIIFLLSKKGFSFCEVPIIFVNRKYGKSNTDFSEYLKSLLAIIKIRLRG